MQSLQEPRIFSTGGGSQYQRIENQYKEAVRDRHTALWLKNGLFIVVVVLTIIIVIGSLTGFFHVVDQITTGLITGFLGGPLLTWTHYNEWRYYKIMASLSDKLGQIEERDELRAHRDITSDQTVKENSDRVLQHLDDLIYGPSDDNQGKIAPQQKPALQNQETPQKLEEQIQASTDYKDGYTGNS